MTNDERIEKILKSEKILHPEEYFTWKKYSWAVTKYCPEYLNPNKFNWKSESFYIVEYCPQHFNSNKYNWKKDSDSLVQFCPQLFNSKKYNWKIDSWAVIKYCPEKLDINKANLNNIIRKYPKYKDMTLKRIKQIAILNKI